MWEDLPVCGIRALNLLWFTLINPHASAKRKTHGSNE